jgi:NAD(P)-dependent dehydrogenase (short-subunit alcohol dehydrogenase family)
MSVNTGKKVVLVTGAAGTLVKAVCARIESAGYSVAATDGVDLSKSAEVDRLRADLDSKSGTPDAIVHCAGGFRWSKIDELSQADWDFLMASNLTSTWQVLRAFLPQFRKRGSGSVVLVGSKAALAPGMGMGAYSASKAGLHALVASAAEELKDTGVRINAVLPSIIDTPANRKDMPEADFSRWVTPTALAEIIFGLTQASSEPIRGALIPVAGRV